MTNADSRPRWTRWLTQLAQGAAAAAGLVYGYGFGARLAGVPLGIVTAVCSAVFCVMVVDGIADWALRGLARWRARQLPPQ